MGDWVTIPTIKTITLYRKGQFIVTDVCGCRKPDRQQGIIFYRLNCSSRIHIVFKSEKQRDEIMNIALSMFDNSDNDNNFLILGEDVVDIFDY